MNQTMTYDKLYNNMVKKFTVEKDNTDYTLGDYMLMKARAKKNAMTVAATSNLPVAHEPKVSSLTAVFSYVGEKLKIKKAPVRDKTIRSFPFRTSFTALCSAVVVCALVVCCAIFGASSSFGGKENIVSVQDSDAQIDQTVVEQTLMNDYFETI